MQAWFWRNGRSFKATTGSLEACHARARHPQLHWNRNATRGLLDEVLLHLTCRRPSHASFIDLEGLRGPSWQGAPLPSSESTATSSSQNPGQSDLYLSLNCRNVAWWPTLRRHLREASGRRIHVLRSRCSWLRVVSCPLLRPWRQVETLLTNPQLQKAP